jgi:hypothetical protein
MKHKKKKASRPTSVVLTDWSADPQHIGKSSRDVIYELMLSSLLYDEVLVQDEVFALSTRLAGWFSPGKDIDLLIKCLDLGTLRVLTHPVSAYLTDNLRELSTKAPIWARAQYIQDVGTLKGHIFAPTQLQEAFYHALDSHLLAYPHLRRPVGFRKRVDIFSLFGKILKEVLSTRHYRKWIGSAFKGVTQSMADEFVDCIIEPEKAIARIRDRGRECKVVAGADGRPVINRSLVDQLAELYPPTQLRAMKNLTQTAFAAPFCWREEAVGRYSRSLRELLWVPAAALGKVHRKEEVVSVEAHVDIPMSLPDLNSDFPRIIQRVRESESGRNLRASIQTLGEEVDFQTQVECWRAVADELARGVTRPKQVNVLSALLRVGRRMISGATVKGLYEFSKGKGVDLPDVFAAAFFTAAFGIVFDHGLEVIRNDLLQQRIRGQLERAVEFRCASLPMPPMIDDDVPAPGGGSIGAAT